MQWNIIKKSKTILFTKSFPVISRQKAKKFDGMTLRWRAQGLKGLGTEIQNLIGNDLPPRVFIINFIHGLPYYKTKKGKTQQNSTKMI